MRSKGLGLLYFLIGLGMATKVNIIGFVGISQIFFFLAAPILYMRNYGAMKRDGFHTLTNLSLVAFVGCLVSSLYNHTQFALMARGLALCYTWFSSIVVFYYLIKRDASGLKWLFVGLALSQIITIWGFRTGVETSAMLANGEEVIKDRESWFMVHFGGMFTLPLYAFFMHTPIALSWGICCFPAVWTMVRTSSGRSAVLTLIVTSVLILFVGRSPLRMRKLKQKFVLIMIVTLSCGLAFASLYKYLGSHGLLNEKANDKYQIQMAKKKSGVLGSLMAGRSEFFVGTFAALENPIFGCGPWPLDKKGYYQDFLVKYGNAEDIDRYFKYIEWRNQFGEAYSLIPTHSGIVCGWIYNGILGLPYYIYLFWLMFTVLRKHLDAVPQWFGYFAFIIPGELWNIFFSPPGNDISPLMAMLLYALAIGRRKLQLPRKMQVEAMKHVK